MKTIFVKVICILIVSSLVFSCKKDEEPIVTPASFPALDGLVKLKEGYAPGASVKVEIWGEKNFFVGYNKLTVVLYDSVNSTKFINNARINFLPSMTMMSGSHSAPIENPDTQSVGDVYKGAVVFQMPTVDQGTWKLNVNVDANSKEGQVSFDITVDNPTTSLMNMFTTLMPDSNKLILTLLKPLSPVVGINDIEFTLHRKASMSSYPADDSYTIEIDPQMPSMGHGSPNNVNPVSVGNGHYTGKVNFIMTGWWRVNVLIKKGTDTLAQNIYYDITF